MPQRMQLDAENTKIPLNKLKLDPENPRLPTRLRHAKEQEVFSYMLKNEGIPELMESITQNGYFEAEPLLVIKDPADGFYTAVEGNRRLCALILLRDPGKATHRNKSINEIYEKRRYDAPSEVPVIIYPDRETILECLGFRHVTGIKSWGALEKARYLKQLYKTIGDNMTNSEKFKILASKIGSKSHIVKNLLSALWLYEFAEQNDYFGIPEELSEDRIDFSLLTTALTYSGIKEFINAGAIYIDGDDSKNIKPKEVEDLFHWIYEEDSHGNTKIGESRQLKNLAAIVANAKAVEVLRSSGNMEKASLYTGILDNKFLTLINTSERNLSECKNMLEQLNEPDGLCMETLSRIEKTCKTLASGLRELYFSNPEDGNNA